MSTLGRREIAEHFAAFMLADKSKGERRRVGDEVVGRCPLPDHEDRRPSFRFNVAKDAAVCTCSAATGKGSKLRDLLHFEANDARNTRPTTSSLPTSPGYASEDEAAAAICGRINGKNGGRWRYENADGSPCFTVLRIDKKAADGSPEKEYRPLHRGRDGRWRIGDPARAALPLYGLPTLTGASRVAVLEGEKCADAATQLGLVATTSSHGAKSAKRSFWGPLAGKDVTIFPDNDVNGRAYAEEVKAILSTLTPPARVRIVELPGRGDGEDLADFVAKRETEGKTREATRAEIEAIIAATRYASGESAAETANSWEPRPPISAGEIRSLAVEPVEWIVEPILAKRQVTLFVAGPKGMKSNLSLALMLGVANGNWPCGIFKIPAAAKVAYFSFEDGKRRVARRLLKFAGQIPAARFPDVWGSETVPAVKLPADEANLIAWIQRGGYTVLVLDVLLYTADVKDESSSAEMQPWCASVRRIADATGAAILVLHHKRKGQRDGSSLADLARGSSVVAGLADSILVLERTDETHLIMEQIAKDAPPARWTVTYLHEEPKPWTIEPAGYKDFGVRAKVRLALERATADKPDEYFGASTIATLAGVHQNIAREHLKALAAEGKATAMKRNDRGGGFVYSAVFNSNNNFPPKRGGSSGVVAGELR